MLTEGEHVLGLCARSCSRGAVRTLSSKDLSWPSRKSASLPNDRQTSECKLGRLPCLYRCYVS